MSQPSNLVTVTQKRVRCRHVHATGHQCGSPALRHEDFCYFHHTTRRPKPTAGQSRHFDATEPFELPLVEDFPSALSVAAQLLCRIASNDLDHQRAGKLLYNLQIITGIIDKASRAAAKAAPAPRPEPLEELVEDEAHGLIAPITEYVPAAPLAADAAEPATPPERAYTEEEKFHLLHTVFSRGYHPQDEYPRPASVTDEDICAYTDRIRRLFRLPLLEPHKDADGRLISIHEQGDQHTIPAVAPQPATDSPQTTTIPTLNAAIEQSEPRTTSPTTTNAEKPRPGADWRAKQSLVLRLRSELIARDGQDPTGCSPDGCCSTGRPRCAHRKTRLRLRLRGCGIRSRSCPCKGSSRYSWPGSARTHRPTSRIASRAPADR